MQLDLDFNAARMAAQQGMTQAVDHADRKEPGWSDVALLFLKKYASDHRGERFTSESVRRAAEAWGLEAPTTPKAWGAVFQKGARDKVIRKVGYAPHSERHASPTVEWEGL